MGFCTQVRFGGEVWQLGWRSAGGGSQEHSAESGESGERLREWRGVARTAGSGEEGRSSCKHMAAGCTVAPGPCGRQAAAGGSGGGKGTRPHSVPSLTDCKAPSSTLKPLHPCSGV